MSEYAVLFDLKEFALHDGPGVRTTVFFKGCPLRCIWCHNPEGLSPQIELMTKETRCLHCGKCRTACSHPECQPFGRCMYACPEALISICGKRYSLDELYARLTRDTDFLRESGGGITFSGGEPLMQADFLHRISTRLQQDGVHTAVETSGYSPLDVFVRATESIDLVIMDLKLADSHSHRQYTGVENDWILAAAAWLRASGKEHLFRTPLIPGITDTEENLSAIEKIVGDSPWEKLPYNTLAGAKYPMLGKIYPYEAMQKT